MNGSIFQGEKWCFFICEIVEGKAIENPAGAAGDPETLDAILP